MPDPDSPQPVFEFYRSWIEPSDHFPTSDTGVVLHLWEHGCADILLFLIEGDLRLRFYKDFCVIFFHIYSKRSQLY